MNASRLLKPICLSLLLLILLACNFTGFRLPAGIPVTNPTPGSSYATTLATLPQTIVEFHVTVPADTPEENIVYLSLMDEVTGLAISAKVYPMEALRSAEPVTGTLPTRHYSLAMPFPIGSVVQYRYERQSDAIRVAEHTSDGSPVRYRLYVVNGPGIVTDVVSRWTDTTFSGPTGRIEGQISDAQTGLPIPNLLITAGGLQTITTAEGGFLLDGLPPGVHNLVAYAMDGSYRPFQQGARVAADSMTPAVFSLEAVPMVKMIFVVSVPEGTPPAVPLRLAGNLYALGNSFANLTGGVNSLASNMPILSPLPDGRYTVTLDLPVGADIRYKYTLGDGLWNAEHFGNGEFRLRQMIVPDHNAVIEEVVETWYAGTQNAITFDLSVPADTPADDFIAIQFNPLFGWTEPIPMWHLGGSRWAYILYSPLNLPGNFSYRYCRNGQCGYGDDVQTPGLYGAGRPLKITAEAQTVIDQVTAWVNPPAPSGAIPLPSDTVNGREATTWLGVELAQNYHPSWKASLPRALDDIQALGANWLVLTPTWTYLRSTPGNEHPVLQLLSGSDALWFDTFEAATLGRQRNLQVALNPKARFFLDMSDWWQSAPRDASWWTIWFEQYRGFVRHHANLAARSGATALILGGEWVTPALPGGTLADGTPSGVPEEAAERWKNLIAEVRSLFTGKLLWALPASAAQTPPAFLNLMDGVYLEWTLPPETANEAEIAQFLDYTLWPLQIKLNTPMILALTIPSLPDSQAQWNGYDLLLRLMNGRSWLGGIVSCGYYPPVALQDNSPSVHGKPSSELLRFWYMAWLGR